MIKKISGKSFEPGKKLLEKGGLILPRLDKGVFRGRVLDDVVHYVNAHRDGDGGFLCDCTCASLSKICKHAVALLLHTSSNLKEITKYEEHGGNVADHLLTELSPDDASDFTTAEFVNSAKPFNRLLTRLGIRDVNAYIDSMYEIYQMVDDLEATYGFWTTAEVDFTKFFKRIKKCKKDKEYLEAARICQGISEGIANNMERIDDSNGYHGDMFQKILREMAICINKADLNHMQKRPYISYLYEMFIMDDPDYFAEHYPDILKAVCTTREDLEYWKTLHKPFLPKKTTSPDFCKNCRLESLVEMHTDILGMLKKL